MGLISGLLGLPLQPVRVVVRLAEAIQQAAEEEYRNPATVRQMLEAAEDAYASGALSDEEYRAIQENAIDRLGPASPI